MDILKSCKSQLKNPKIFPLTLFLLVLGMVLSCSKNPKCWGKDKNKGVIENSVDIPCIPVVDEVEFVITNDSIYNQFLRDSITGELHCSLPTIDFKKYSLLGLYTSGRCEVKFIREVTIMKEVKKYHYKVTVKTCGACKKEGVSYNWVTVPKIPKGWNVSFEVD